MSRLCKNDLVIANVNLFEYSRYGVFESMENEQLLINRIMTFSTRKTINEWWEAKLLFFISSFTYITTPHLQISILLALLFLAVNPEKMIRVLQKDLCTRCSENNF